MEARCSPILPVYKTTKGTFIQQVAGGFRLIKPTLIPRLDTTSDRAVAESGINEETEESFYSISEILEGQKDLTRGTLESERRAIWHNDLMTDAPAAGPTQSYASDIKSRIMAAVEARWKALSLELIQVGAGGGLVFLASVIIYAIYNTSNVYKALKKWVKWSRGLRVECSRGPAEFNDKNRDHSVEMNDQAEQCEEQRQRMLSSPPKIIAHTNAKMTATILVICLILPAFCEDKRPRGVRIAMGMSESALD